MAYSTTYQDVPEVIYRGWNHGLLYKITTEAHVKDLVRVEVETMSGHIIKTEAGFNNIKLVYQNGKIDYY